MRLQIVVGLMVCLVMWLPTDSRAGAPSIAINPASISADELAEMLGVSVWKFDVSVPAGAKQAAVTLQKASKGQAPSQWGVGATGQINNDFKHEVIVAIVPIGGSNSDADKVRVILSAFGMFTETTTDNPLKSLGTGKPQRPENAGNGVFNLIGGYAGSTIKSPVSVADVIISLKIETK